MFITVPKYDDAKENRELACIACQAGQAGNAGWQRFFVRHLRRCVRGRLGQQTGPAQGTEGTLLTSEASEVKGLAGSRSSAASNYFQPREQPVSTH